MARFSMHPDWIELKARLDKRMEASLERLMSPATDLEMTNFIRGEISAIRAIITEAEGDGPPAAKPATPGRY